MLWERGLTKHAFTDNVYAERDCSSSEKTRAKINLHSVNTQTLLNLQNFDWDSWELAAPWFSALIIQILLASEWSPLTLKADSLFWLPQWLHNLLLTSARPATESARKLSFPNLRKDFYWERRKTDRIWLHCHKSCQCGEGFERSLLRGYLQVPSGKSKEARGRKSVTNETLVESL